MGLNPSPNGNNSHPGTPLQDSYSAVDDLKHSLSMPPPKEIEDHSNKPVSISREFARAVALLFSIIEKEK